MITLTQYEYGKDAAESSRQIVSRFDFVFDSKAEFEYFVLDDMPRVVFDFNHVHPVPKTWEIDDGLVIRVRFGHPRDGVMRVVFDMAKTHPFFVQVRENPPRISVRFSRTLLHVLHNDSIVQMEAEDYLSGVVAAEMPGLFHLEALRAQAVASRSYTAWRMKVLGGRGCSRHEQADICTDAGHCQAWVSREQQQERWGKDYQGYREKIESAVRDTRFAVVTYNGKVADALYHSTCGGKTENAADVWGKEVQYLQSVRCEHDSHSPYFARTYHVKIAELLQKTGTSGCFVAATPTGEPLLSRKEISNTQALQSLYVAGKEIPGAEFRRLLDLPSQWVDWSVDTVVLKTKGFGHRVGMCQYGADGYAKKGWNWEKILKHYYRGAAIAQLDQL